MCPKLYGLPKIHKPNLPLRPIVSSTRSPTSVLSKWLVSICKPLLSTQISYIKNSSNLVEKLKKVEISSNSLLSSFDIVSMYTNIDVEAAETLLEGKLLRNLDLISGKTDLEVSVIMYLVRLCNKFSYFFQFRGEYFEQINGLPMGAPLSPLLANIFVENIETIALDSYFLKHIFWGRYMDDIISVWDYGEEELKGFLEHLNCLGGDLKFTVELEENGKLPFLDVLLLKNQNSLDFKIYRKPTNNNRFLSYSSGHARQVKIGLIISLTDRIFSICSPKFVEEELSFLRKILISNMYPEWLINQTFSKRRKRFLEISKEVLETTREKDVFCSLPYVPGLSEKLKRILQSNGLRVALKSNNTLGSFLNSGKDLTSLGQQSGVYQIPCTCGSSYVGRTNQSLEMRLLQHKDSISSALKQDSKSEDFTSALSEHIFNFPDHFILFENVSLISRDRGLKQNFRETLEIKKILFKNIALNRDTGEYGLNSIYDNLLKSDRVKFNSPNVVDLCPNVISLNANEPNPRRSKRLASAFALKRIRDLNNM